MVHREISRMINQDFDDLKARNPKAYRESEQEYARFQQKVNFRVAMSRVPGHVREAERQQ